MKLQDILLYLSYILVIVAAVFYVPFRNIAPYVMFVGSAGLLAFHMLEKYEGTDLRQRRNIRTRHLVGILYAVAAYFMFDDGMYWLIALMIAAVLEIYTMSVKK